MSPQLRDLAESFAERFIQQYDSADTKPGTIILATYENQLDYETLRPEDQPARVEDHTEMISHIQQIIDWEYSGTGPQILTPTINATAFFRWLHANNLSNDAANRAAFIAHPPLA